MASVRGRSMVLAVLAGAVLALAAPTTAWAEDPVDFGSTPIVDTVGALDGSTDEVIAAIDRAADSSGRQLFVAYVDEFTNPEAADAWANDTAIANNMGAEDYLLAVATVGRAYYLSAASDASLSDSDVDRIMLEVIEPELRDEDWAGAAIAAADALAGGSGGRAAEAAAGAGSGSSSSRRRSSRSSRSCSLVAGRRSRSRAARPAGRPCRPSTISAGRPGAPSCRPTTP